MDSFVSMPDFFNADVADLAFLTGRQFGQVNSLNAHWRQAIDRCLDLVEAENPQAVWVAGDLVEGHWDTDTNNDQMFGPVSTLEEQTEAVKKAADVYYTYWRKLWSDRDIPVYPALGDHEIGDDRLPNVPVDERWSGPENADRFALIPTYKAKFGEHFPMTGCDHATGNSGWTAYAKPFGNTLLVTVDMFTIIHNPEDGIRIGVEFNQLSWLDGVLQANTLPNVIVQGHTPVLWPVHRSYSGGLHVSAGADSEFWACMKDHHVPLFLCGEVHAITAIAPPGAPVQVSHGSLFHRGCNFLRLDVDDDGRIELTSKVVPQTVFDDTNTLWGTALEKRPAAKIAYARQADTVGTMTIDNGVVTERSGSLDVAADLGWTY